MCRKNNFFLKYLGILVLLVSCPFALFDSTATAATINVDVQNFAFSPATLDIQKGDVVHWIWRNGSHSVTSGSNCTADGKFDSAVKSAGFEFSQRFDEAGDYPYFCTPHCSFGMTGLIHVAEADNFDPGNPITQPIKPGNVMVKLTPLATGLTAPNWGTSAPGDTGRLFVTDQVGTLWAIDLASGNKSVFADLSSLLFAPLGIGGGSYDERGLLGVAFHPSYRRNGLLYTYTSEAVDGAADFSTQPAGTAANHQSVIREWRVPNPRDTASVADPGSSRVVLRIDEPQFNHNGGGLNFGKDGMLYISTGDGGNADDQGDGHGSRGNGQDRGNVLGKILRINPNVGTAANGQYGIPGSNPFFNAKRPSGGPAGCADGKCDEIYAYGLRNPFRFSFDLPRGDLYVGDVGQNAVEEVDVIKRGGNYGWRVKEGTFCFDPKGSGDGVVTAATSCGKSIDPVAQYDHDEGHAIIGGFVYRGAAIPDLQGRYVFGDYARTFNNDGRLFYLTRKNIVGKTGVASGSSVVEMQLSGQTGLGLYLLGLGQDAQGELYVLGNQSGTPQGESGVVMKIEP